MGIEQASWLSGVLTMAVAVVAVIYTVRRERLADDSFFDRRPVALGAVLAVLLVALAGALAATLIIGLG